MRSRCKVQLAGALVLLVLTGCGHPKSFNEVRVQQPRGPKQMQQSVNVIAAAGRAIQRRQNEQVMFLVAVGNQAKHNPQAFSTGSSPDVGKPTPPASVLTATPSSMWDCIAIAETGGDYGMHGSSYSSAYGVMNQAVRENAPPDAAARILAGTASKDEQLAMAMSVANRHGIGAWAKSTVAKCAG